MATVKRGIVVDALSTYGVSLYGEGKLPINPLTLLSEQDRAAVFAPRVGQEKRLTHLFMTLPGVVIPRSAILTVCAGNDDPMRRARALKNRFAAMGWKLLCGKWEEERVEGAALGYDLSGAAWVAIKNVPDN
ncbi:NaeI family type II restriction endonuclease [Actinomadura sediminis]|uniref:NaeI family type II restriction endonuclease n=1 Tax=Actinomadura sediminis TaxID=1038904 RepID=A0ABW3F0D3_9ACTN